MATNGKAWAHGSTTHPARVLRNETAAGMGLPWGTHANAATATTRGGAYGVVGDGDLLVTTTGSLGYSVAAGRIVCPGTFAAAQGLYVGYNDAAIVGSVSARHATLTRVDYIAYRVRDTDEDATGAEDDGVVVIAGTAGSGAPSLPAALGSLVILSEVTVPSSAVGTPLTFTDRRTKASALGGVQRVTSTTRPTGIALWEGLYIDESDTERTWRYSGAAWQPVKGRFGVDMYNPGAVLATGALYDVDFTVEDYDTDGYHAGSATTATIPAGLGGIYSVTVRVNATDGVVSSQSSISVKKNGTTVQVGWMPGGTAYGGAALNIALAAGDTIGVLIGNGHSANRTYLVQVSIARLMD